jgi:xanthine dehydrogenase accessory factor
MEVFIEPVEASPELYVFGAGHVGQFVGKMAHEVGFRVHVVDDREKFANTERFGPGIDVVVDDIPAWLEKHALPATTYAVVVTRGHRHDLETMRGLLRSPLRYLGLIGSKAKVKRIFDALSRRAPPGVLARPRADRLDIGAVSPRRSRWASPPSSAPWRGRIDGRTPPPCRSGGRGRRHAAADGRPLTASQPRGPSPPGRYN